MPSHQNTTGDHQDSEVRVGLCVHGCFAAGFIAANREAIRALAAQMAMEIVVVESTEPLPAIEHAPTRALPMHGLEYNAALLAAPRYSRADLVMWCDASDRLQPENIADAAMWLDRDTGLSAVVGGTMDVADGFSRLLSPLGILLRREAGLRFVRAHEYGLVGNYETLAQLEYAGGLVFEAEALSRKERIPFAGYWRMSLRDLAFERSRPERYAGHLCLYDPLTLERYLADAEHFLLQRRDRLGLDAPPRERMFAKQAALYGEAARQAAEDAAGTCALLFATRERVLRAVLDAGETPALLSEPETERLLVKALAEQVCYLADIFSTSRMRIEDHPATRALAPFLPPALDAVWDGDSSAVLHIFSTLFVFATDQSQAAFRGARRDDTCFSVSIERLTDILTSPLARPRR